jgi:alpha-amylase
MIYVIFCFHVHQPFRLKHYKLFEIGKNLNYFDDELNERIFRRASEKCYLPMNELLLNHIRKFEGAFKISFSITGTFVEQAYLYRPEVMDSFKTIAREGGAEFIGETYYHSLSCLFDEEEFLQQVRLHSEMIEREFGVRPRTFRNTELVYSNRVSDLIAEIPDFRLILLEGTEKILKENSPLYARRSHNYEHILLFRHYRLSDDIAFRFSDKSWAEYPLTAEKFAKWVADLSLSEKEGRNLYLLLYMDYETFGEHQWKETGIFEFMKKLPELLLKHKHISFSWPSDVLETLNYEPEILSVPFPVSWADTERDLSAWLSNPLQWNAMKTYFEILKKVKEKRKMGLMETARRLSSSDLYYYMCIKYFADGDVHKYFSPYDRPEDAYIYFMHVLTDLEKRIEEG